MHPLRNFWILGTLGCNLVQHLRIFWIFKNPQMQSGAIFEKFLKYWKWLNNPQMQSGANIGGAKHAFSPSSFFIGGAKPPKPPRFRRHWHWIPDSISNLTCQRPIEKPHNLIHLINMGKQHLTNGYANYLFPDHLWEGPIFPQPILMKISAVLSQLLYMSWHFGSDVVFVF